jgi:UDP-N-acetylmuramoylalanine--D-glutamate ligase
MNQDSSDFLVLNEGDQVLKKIADETRAKVVYFCESAEFNPNQAAVIAVSSILSIDKHICLKVLQEFKGLEHRFEYVTEINNVKFINDSKATLVESTIWAIKNISSPVILIAGGKDKGVDYKVILDIAVKKVKEVILIGEAKEKIKKEFEGYLSIDEASTLEEAVSKAYLKASPGDSVLLSPMCSSFDMFSNYEERGNCFKKAVLNLAKVNR